MSLENKWVLITGSARRIGRALALGMAKAGGNVIIHHAHSPSEAESTRQEIIDLGREAIILSADLMDPKEACAMLREAWSIHPLAALVNNAAIFKPVDWKSTTPEDWKVHFDLNLTAPFFLCQEFALLASESAPGTTSSRRILNILDWRALRPGADHLPYTISKAALAALTRSLAISLAPEITVNGLALGAILPPESGPPAPNLISMVPAGRWASLDEVIAGALFFLDGPQYVTGEILHLDGGRHLV